MTSSTESFATAWPVAWTFHRASSRWTYNAGTSDEDSLAPKAALEHPDAPFTALPEPMPSPLDHILRRRFSCRRFANTPIPLADLSTLLFAAYGILARSSIGPLEFLERGAPSAGGLSPLELYVVVRTVRDVVPGVYHYSSITHGLELRREVLVPEPLMTYLFMGQPYAASGACVVVITGVPQRSFPKYGDRGYRYMLLEAGHVGQNLTLAAIALNLGICSLGGFFDDELGDLLGIDAQEQPLLYSLVVGTAEPGDRERLRCLEAEP